MENEAEKVNNIFTLVSGALELRFWVDVRAAFSSLKCFNYFNLILLICQHNRFFVRFIPKIYSVGIMHNGTIMIRA